MQKILSPQGLFGINAAIIVAAQTIDGGMLFVHSGLIHAIALLFVGLAFVRLFNRPNIYDPILGKFTFAAIVAMVIFAAAHSIEFLKVVVFDSHGDVSYANMTNLILLAILLLALAVGAEMFLWRLERRGRILLGGFLFLIVVLLGFLAYVVFNPARIWIPVDHPILYIYTAATIVLCSIVLWEALQIRTKVVFMDGFIKYIAAAVILIGFNMLSNIVYGQLIAIGVPEYQLIYFNHFVFYIVLSLFFLAFAQLRHLGGILDEISAKSKKPTLAQI